MVEHSLGKTGRMMAWVLYLFLFYAVLVAYMVLSGNHFSALFKNAIPDWAGTLFFVLIFGWLIYLGTRPVDLVNRALMFGKIAAFVGLVLFGMQFMRSDNLTYSNVSLIFFALPILVISFGFHNMLPSLCAYLKNDVKRIKKAVWGGSLLTLFIYVIWEVVAIGILPESVITAAFRADIDAAQAIQNYLHQPVIGSFSGALAFFCNFNLVSSAIVGAFPFLERWTPRQEKAHESTHRKFLVFGIDADPPLGFCCFIS